MICHVSRITYVDIIDYMVLVYPSSSAAAADGAT